MIKNITQLEHVIGDRIYHFACDPQSPLNEVKEALYKFLGYVSSVEAEIVKQAQTPPESAPSEAQPVEPKAE